MSYVFRAANPVPRSDGVPPVARNAPDLPRALAHDRMLLMSPPTNPLYLWYGEKSAQTKRRPQYFAQQDGTAKTVRVAQVEQ